MKGIHPSILSELQASELRPFFLFNMAINGDPYRYTDCDIPLYFGGERWSRLGFRPDPASYSKSTIVDQCTVEVDNVDEEMTALFVGGNVSGSDIGLQVVVLDEDYNIVGDESLVVFSGEIDSWELDPDDRLRVTMTNFFVRWNQRTLALHSSSCRWKTFKGPECKYTGGVSECDRTYTTCQTLANTDNFGGFRWLPSIEDKVIWWGRVFGERTET
jgi:hypothetical protein